MPRHPTPGIAGLKPRLPKPNGKLSREEAHKLDREYRIHRNQALQLRNHREAMLLAKSRNQLIEKKLVMLQAAYLLTGMRQKVLSFPHALPRRLVGKNEHEIGQILREECHALLRDLATWPERMTDPDWIEKIDPDLRGQVEDADDGEAAGGGFVEDPSRLMRRTEQAEQRREKKTETMRKLRAEGRSKS